MNKVQEKSNKLENLTNKELILLLKKTKDEADVLINRTLFLIKRVYDHPYPVYRDELNHSLSSMEIKEKEIKKDYDSLFEELNKRLSI